MTTTPTPTWILIPFLNAPAMTLTAVEDSLAQSVPTRVLLIDQGASKEDREAIDRYIEQREDQRVLAWHWLPALPSLSAVWNRALRFVWELGGEEALVVNNDVRLHRCTVEHLAQVRLITEAYFVSAVGVREGQFDPASDAGMDILGSLILCEALERATAERNAEKIQMIFGALQKGGPDFSCFLLSKAGHDRYPFDEAFIPAYHEDLDMHRRYMLGGDGDKIFSVNLPFLHYASGTLKDYTPEQRAKFNQAFMACKAYYTRKWGGGPNEETFWSPFDLGATYSTAGLPDPPTTPNLQRHWQISRRPTDGQATT